MTENKHHVAWADRLGLNKIWHDAISYCRMCFGTEEFRQSVFIFYHLIVNIKDGPDLKKMISDYKNGEWEDKIRSELEKWRDDNPALRDELEVIQDEEERIRNDHMIDLFVYILQLLESEGFGFYKSTEIKHGRDGYLHYNEDEDNED